MGGGFTSLVVRCSEGIVGVGCIAVWTGRADFDTGGDILREGWRLVLAVMNGTKLGEHAKLVPPCLRFPSFLSKIEISIFPLERGAIYRNFEFASQSESQSCF